MPVYHYNAKRALELTDANSFSSWSNISNSATLADQKTFADQRLQQQLFTPQFKPLFQFNHQESLFAIGSCFARGIEGKLQKKGFHVESRPPELESLKLAQKKDGQVKDFPDFWHITNQYNIPSILQTLRWALDDDFTFPEKALVEEKSGLFRDPHMAYMLASLPFNEAVERRRLVDSLNRRIRKCRVVVITLGLIETWRDELTKMHLCRAPGRHFMIRHPERFTFHVLSYEENFQWLEETHSLLSNHCPQDLEIVITVSPVPCLATFTDRDVVLANSFSKSMLRTAAESFAALHENVHYFPSYEIVMNSDPQIAWKADRRHVESIMVNHITKIFTAHYCAEIE